MPEPVVRRRFERSIRNFLLYYRPLADSWMLFDNSEDSAIPVAVEKGGKLVVRLEEVYGALLDRYGEK